MDIARWRREWKAVVGGCMLAGNKTSVKAGDEDASVGAGQRYDSVRVPFEFSRVYQGLEAAAPGTVQM